MNVSPDMCKAFLLTMSIISRKRKKYRQVNKQRQKERKKETKKERKTERKKERKKKQSDKQEKGQLCIIQSDITRKIIEKVPKATFNWEQVRTCIFAVFKEK